VSSADRAAREGALLVPRPDLTTLVVTGSERAVWLGGLVTSDVARLASGEATWGLALTKPGKILADVVVLAREGELLVAVSREVSGSLFDWFSGFLIMEDAELGEPADTFAWAALHGPRAGEHAATLAARLEGYSAAVDFTGLGGAILAVPSARAAELGAAAAALPELAVATDEEWTRLRVERLVPLHGVDIGVEDNPHEASLDRRSVSWTKGCYLGQEAVCMQDMRGRVKRRLAVVVLDGDGVPEAGAEIRDERGAAVGEVRSVAESAVLGGAAAIARLGAAASAPGTVLSVAGRAARVVEPA
jgi:folate-binding protein YgfZ